MVTDSLQNTLSYSLADACYSETRTAELLPALANLAGRTEIWQAFHRYGLDSRQRAAQLDKQLEAGEHSRAPRQLTSIAAILDECHQAIAATDDAVMRDALILAAGKRLAHFQIASYESLLSLAKVLGQDDLATTICDLLKDHEQTSTDFQMLADTVVYLPQRELNETS